MVYIYSRCQYLYFTRILSSISK